MTDFELPSTKMLSMHTGGSLDHETKQWKEKEACAWDLWTTSIKILVNVFLCELANYASVVSCLFFQIKFYWNTAMVIHLYTSNGCFHPTAAELSSYNTDHMAWRVF